MSRAKETTPSPVRTRRNSISHDRILNVAEEIAASSALDLSMREIAHRLQCTPMALYRYFPRKEALLNSLLDRILGRFNFVESDSDWRTELTRFAEAHRRMLEEHPWALRYLFENPAPGIGASRIGETAFSILRRGGITGIDAVAVFSGIIALNYGWSSFVNSRNEAVFGGDAALTLEETIDILPPESYPLTKELRSELSRYGSDAHYELLIERFCSSLKL